jgi:hypothetical protein
VETAKSAYEAAQEETVYHEGRDLIIDYADEPRAWVPNPPSTTLWVGNFFGSTRELEDAFRDFDEKILRVHLRALVR